MTFPEENLLRIMAATKRTPKTIIACGSIECGAADSLIEKGYAKRLDSSGQNMIGSLFVNTRQITLEITEKGEQAIKEVMA